MKSREILPLEQRGLYEVCGSAQDVQDYAETLEEALEAAEKELEAAKSMNRDEFKTLMLNIRTAGRLIEHENLKGEAWLDRLFDTLKQVYYLNDLERTNNMGTESGN